MSDPGSVGRFALVGGTLHRPYFLGAFALVDKLPLQRVHSTLARAFVKTCVTQVTVFPVFLGLFFPYIALLEGKPLAEKRSAATNALLHGSLFWPAANMFNFTFVPSSGRVYYAAAVGLMWNTYVSFLNARKHEHHRLEEVNSPQLK